MDTGASQGQQLRCVQATPEQQAAIERWLNGQGPTGSAAGPSEPPATATGGRDRLVGVIFVWSPGTAEVEPPATRPRPDFAADDLEVAGHRCDGKTGRCVFRKMGPFWRVVYDGAEFPLEDTLGARYLDYLLHHPNEPISAFDLEVAVSPEKGKVRSRNSIQPEMDEAAARQYLREMERLRADRDEAASSGALGQADQIDEQIERLADELKRKRRSVDTGERARGNVSKAIKVVCRKLMSRGPHERAFARHIAAQVSLGFEIFYSHPPGRSWE